MSEANIVLNVHMEAVPGREKELESALRALLQPTRLEPGCLVYELHGDPEHPGKFMFYERFKSQAALDEHVNSPHFKKFSAYRAANEDPVAVVNVIRWRVIG
jgi:quinol monooxygenase YgiN